jgi:hypothetical protein
MNFWIARERDGKLSMFTSKPKLSGEFFGGKDDIALDTEMFPWLTTDESPIEVKMLWNKNAKEVMLDHNFPGAGKAISAQEEMSTADNFAKTLLSNPDAIIEWCQAEIREYQKLMDILRKAKPQ